MLGYPSISIHRLYESITQELISAHAGRPAATRSSRFPHFTDVCHADGVYGLDVGREEMSHARP